MANYSFWMWEAFIMESCLNSDLHMWILTLLFYIFNSDCWRNCKFCSLCFRTSYSGHSSWRTQHYHQAWQKSESTYIIHNSFSSFKWFLYIKPYCSAVLAHIILREKLHIFGVLGCVLCVVGSITIVLHAPQERQIESVTEVWDLATEPGNSLVFLQYFLV